MDDADAPVGLWVHWVLFNLSADVTSLPEGVPSDPSSPEGGLHGVNSWRRIGYGGPCPPSGTHRYFFKLYALDAPLTALSNSTTARELEAAMRGHVLAQAQLMGRYARK
jgi:Raf kinase inhibitor-like YbhB/YbcL family protein